MHALNLKDQSAMAGRLRQHGFVTLAVVVMSLVVASAVIAYAYRGTIGEIGRQSDAQATLAARNAAEAGVEYAIGLINSSPATYLNADGTLLDPDGDGQTVIPLSLGSMTVQGVTLNPQQKASVVVTRLSAASPLQLVSVGGYRCGSAATAAELKSDCDAASLVEVMINLNTASSTGFPGLRDGVYTLGSAVFDGSSCIQGGGGGNAVHAGGTVQRTNTFSGDDCFDNNGKGIYGDTFENDGNLASLEGAGNEKIVGDELYGQDINDMCAENKFPGTKDASGQTKNMVTFSGKLDVSLFQEPGIYCINGNVTLGGSGNETFGGAGKGEGVMIYVNGTVTSNGNATVNGILHSTGSMVLGSGNVTVNGSLVSNGSLHATGNVKVRFDGDAYAPPDAGGSDANYRVVAGSWKDWQ
ncbi:hypothetical protein ACTSKR_04690 [Chitinibacteraceae bacterium HSL-7]